MIDYGQRREVALVTGGSKGIGREVAGRLAAAGMIVYLGACDSEQGRAAAAALEGDVRAVALDVTDDDDVAAAVRRIDEESGRLDILVNNAGAATERGVPTDEISAALLRASYEVNVVGVVGVTSACVPLLRRSNAGRVVNMSSPLGSLTFVGDPGHPTATRGLLAYNSARAALDAVTLSYANALRADGIRVDAVSAEGAGTDLYPGSPLAGNGGARVPGQRTEGPVGLALLAGAGVPGVFRGGDDGQAAAAPLPR
ncbi:SDR family oxidoreductase [Streptomonospora sediminis]